MSSHFENEITIEDVVDSFSARLENGERPSIEEYKKRYPYLTERIDAVLPALVVLQNVDSDPSDRKLAVDDSIPEVLGDYRIIQEVGRGGMGIVFEAQHSTMRRRVALKVLPKSSAEKPNYLRRFLTEARSAGQLHHTNIVPVFEVGESEGLNYYSMQFIHGDNLDHVIDDIRKLRRESRDNGTLQTTGPKRHYQPKHHSERSQSIALEMIHGDNSQGDNTPTSTISTGHNEKNVDAAVTPTVQRDQNRHSVFAGTTGTTNHKTRNQYHNRVAAVGVQVAEALAHAHEHGVLHRDVKPANLILDTDGNVWITDFGLAKLDTHDLTQTGDIIGTLRYMAPERFAGEADPRSDIYSLGLTLYELSTLKCAFENDRGTLVQDVANSSSVISPRKIDESIPADLETIILKSIEPQPERRYQTAQEMVEDLELFLADRPIRARRATWAEKCWRVCRRNPIASSLAACLALLLVIITAGSIEFARSEALNRKESQKNLFYSKLDQAKMRRYSGLPGQRFEALQAIQDAVKLLPVMDFESDAIRETEFLLRSEVLAATTLTDVQRQWSHDFETGWGQRMRFAIDITGKYFAEGHDEGKIRIRNISDKKTVLELPGGRDKDPPWAMNFSPNGRYLLTRYHQPNVHNEFLTIVWDLENNGEQAYVTKYTRSMCFSKDGLYVGLTYDDRAEVVRLEDGQVVKTIYPEFAAFGNAWQIRLGENLNQVAISQRGSGFVEFWDISRDPYLKQIVECENSVFCMDWDSKRRIFVVGSHRGTLDYWIGNLSEDPHTIQLHQNTIHRIHLHPNHELVATSAWDATTRFTDLVAGKEVLSVEDHVLGYNGFCTNGRLGMRDESNNIDVWHVALPMVQIYSAPEQAGGFTCCIHPRYNNIIGRTIGDDIEFWDIDRRILLARIEGVRVKEMLFSSAGDYFLTSGVSGLCQWNVASDGSYLNLDQHKILIDKSTVGLELSKSNEWLLVGVGSYPTMVDLETGEVIRRFGRHGNLSQVQLTSDDRFALSGTWHGKGVKVWDVATGECVQTVNEEISSAAPVPHPNDPNKFFVGRNHNTEFSINPDEREPSVYLRRKLKYDGTLHLLNDAKNMVVQTNSYNMVLLDTETQQELVKIVSVGQSRVVDKCVSNDGNTMVLACFDSLQVIDLEKLQSQLSALGLDWSD